MGQKREAFRAVQVSLGVSPATGIPNDDTKAAFQKSWDEALAEFRAGDETPGSVPGPALPGPASPPPSPSPGPVTGAPLVVMPDGYLDRAKRIQFPTGRALTPEILVIHFTAGATGESSISFWRELNNGICAHLVIERDGTIKQVRPFNQQCGHAGVSRWRGHSGANQFAIGFELANAGNDDGALSWARKQPGFQSVKAKHRNGGPVVEWEVYPEAQLMATYRAAKAVVDRYKLKDVTGHDCIAPERKDDPGPAFPMGDLRAYCGFAGLPEVFKR